MKPAVALAGLLAVLLLGPAGLAGIEGSVEASGSGAERTEMVDSDFAMLDRMRAATSPVMTTMIREDPMWTDPGMTVPRRGTRIDRMLAKRAGQPWADAHPTRARPAMTAEPPIDGSADAFRPAPPTLHSTGM